MDAQSNSLQTIKIDVPVWFTIIAGMALAWNLLGLAAVLMDFMMSAESIASLPMEQQEMYAARPSWVSFASLLAVFAGTLGCAGLVMKRAWAKVILLLSLFGLIAQDIAFFVILDTASVYGGQVLFMQAIVFIIALGLLALAHWAIKKRWIS